VCRKRNVDRQRSVAPLPPCRELLEDSFSVVAKDRRPDDAAETHTGDRSAIIGTAEALVHP